MKNKAPVAMVSVALLAAALALLASTGGEPTPIPPFTALPSSGCHLGGRVLDAAGAPLPGAEVRARILTAGTAHESTAATTGEDGTFALCLFPARGMWAVLVNPPGRSGFTADKPVRAAPDRRIEIEIREPASPVAEPPPPNVTGEVLDSFGRLLTGIPLFVTNEEGVKVARGLSGEMGRVAFHVTAKPPLTVHAESLEGDSWLVSRLPCGNVQLIVSSLEPEKGEFLVDFRLPAAIENDRARVRIYDDLGQLALTVHRGVREGPHALRGLTFGTFDVRVDCPGLAGAIQGFDFRPDHRLAVVPLSATGEVLGSLRTDARVILFSRSPSRVPVARDFRESDGVKRIYRGAWEEEENVRTFAFAGLPAGDYRLRILARGFETVDQMFALASGEKRDFGAIDLVTATGKIRIAIVDRKDEPGDLEFRYIVRLYERNGLSFTEEVGPGPDTTLEFRDLPAGDWMWRAERVLSRTKGATSGWAESTRRVGWDHPVPLTAGEEKSVKLDCTWRYDRIR